MYGLTPLSEQGSGASFLAEIQVEYVQVEPFIRTRLKDQELHF